jgi:hypothetical protein
MNEHLAVLSEMTYLQARQIVQAYGNTLTNIRSGIADERTLPFPKALIKQAILTVLPFAPSDEMRGSLKSSYLYLADFQPDLEHQVICPLPAEAKPPRTTEELAAVGAHIEKWLPRSERSIAEMQALLQELRDAGFAD